MSSKSTRQSRTDRAEAVRLKQERLERRRRAVMIGGVIAVVLAVVLVGVLVQGARDTSADVTAPPAGSGEYGVTIGDPDAPREVVIYEDFLCPFCAVLEGETRTGLAELADDGQVYVEYRPFELLSRFGDYSARATNAFKVVLEESGPETAKEFHDLLFENQPAEDGEHPDDDQLVEWAVEAGADEAAVEDGIRDQAQSDWVAAATEAADAAGVPGTPTVLVDGEVFQAGGSIEEFAESLLVELR